MLVAPIALAEGTDTPNAPVSETDAVRADIALDAPNSKAAVRELVSHLSDDAARQLLIERLDAVAAAKATDTDSRTAIQVMTDALRVYVANASNNLMNLGRIPDFLSRFLAELQKAVTDFGTGVWILSVLGFLVLGVLAHRGVERLFRRKRAALIEETGYTLLAVLRIVYSRLAIDVLAVVAFFLVAYIGFTLAVPWPGVAHQLGYAIIVTIASWWMGWTVCNFVFAPGQPGLSFCVTDDDRGARFRRDFALLTGFVVALHNIFYLFQTIGFDKLGGLENLSPMGFVLNLSLYVVFALTLWRHRATLTEVLNNNRHRNARLIDGEESATESVFAGNWPKIALILVAIKYLFVEIILNTTDLAVYSTSAVYMTLFVIALWPALDGNVTLFVALGTRATEDESTAASKARVQMQRGLLRVGRILVVGVVLYLLATMWSLDVVAMAESGLGVQAAGNLYEFLFAVLLGYIVWEVITIMARRIMAAETGGESEHDDGGGDMGGVGLSRTATLVPIFEIFAKALVVVVAVLVTLDGLGINITPLLAGSAVVGLAVGFGAQTLVKDIVSGLFFLADDAFRVAEYIEIGETRGTVEKISLRSLRLRHHRGLVHTIPYGEIPKLTNYSRDWVIMKLRFRVPFDTDINKVKKIFKRIGQEMLEHPEIGEDFLQPFKSQGVAEMDDDAIVVRGKFMAKPGRQFMIRKEVYVRVQQA
ncbi:MAG: mechanosensitive ion channel domain-containing protein, partial [Pseudomonadota bacterium]